jgi:bifunctional non-homologous end joining protein LigD
MLASWGIDAELCLPGAGGAPNFYGLQAAMGARRRHYLVVYAFDLLHRDGRDLRALPLTERRWLLERLLARSNVPRLRLVPGITIR